MIPTIDRLQAEQWVYILESSNRILEAKTTGPNPSDYVLEGIAAVFGEENNNNRIYEEKEYLPHLIYLNQKISQKKLLGELDHPEKFDISLKSVSHIVESLTHDGPGRTLKIRVRLLDTPMGRVAKTLVDAGVPISISSRAAGAVSENKTVKIKKIFTYDLVADPGFERAQLGRIYESANFNPTPGFLDTLTDVSQSYGNGNTKVYAVNENDPSFKKAMMDDDKKTNNNMTQYVTVDELNDYSAVIKKEIDAIKEAVKDAIRIKATNEATQNTNDPALTEMINRVTKVEKYVKYLAENLDKTITYSEYLAENLDKNITYSEYLAENLDKNISYSEYLAENLDKNISYSEYLAENLDKNISYSEYLAENLDKNISYSEYLAENLDKNISYSEYLAENLDKNISYSEYLAENLDKNISYSEYLAENLDKGISYSEYLAEKIESNIEYSEFIAESIAKKPADPAAKVNEAKETVANTDTKKYVGLTAKIDQLLEAAKNQKAAPKINESKYHFYRFLGEAKRGEFDALNETEKEKVATALKNGAYFKESDVVSKWDVALTEKTIQDITPAFLRNIPENVRPLYEALTPREKDQVLAQSKSYKLETEYQIKNFWSTRPFAVGKTVGLIKLNENEDTTVASKESFRGYSNDYMSTVAEQLGKRFGKK